MNEAARYMKVLRELTETEFKELWAKAYQKKVEEAQHYWEDYSGLSFSNKDLFMEGRKRLNDLIWKKVESEMKMK